MTASGGAVGKLNNHVGSSISFIPTSIEEQLASFVLSERIVCRQNSRLRFVIRRSLLTHVRATGRGLGAEIEYHNKL